MKTNCAKMKSTIEKILRKQGVLEHFLQSDSFHLKIEEKNLQLSVEKNSRRVAVSKYFEKEGDLIPDPDMEFLIGFDGEWYPISLQTSTGHYFEARHWVNGEEFLNLEETLRQVKFSNEWAREISHIL